MRLLESTQYIEDLGKVTGLDMDWEELRGRSFMISGATGMIGSTLIDVLMKLNREQGLGVRILALGRNEEKARDRFLEYWKSPEFSFLKCDITDEASLKMAFEVVSDKKALESALDCKETDSAFVCKTVAFGEKQRDSLQRDSLQGIKTEGELSQGIDYIFHAASNTHPVAYAQDPIGTITANIIGLNNLLGFGADHGCRRFLFASSNEIYGENRGDVELFDESYCGYIDCNTMRAGYPESKRAGEALCQAYIRQKGLDAVIVRFTRSFGPTLLKSDTKALSQFIRKGVNREDIVLKSAGTQYYSYTYVCDAVSGLLTCLLKGSCGEAYNIADVSCDITLRDLAQTIADSVGTKVVFELPDAVEAAGYSKATKARLDSTKLQGLGWKAQFDMKTALVHTIEVMQGLGQGGSQ